MQLRIGLIQLSISVQLIRRSAESVVRQIQNDPDRFYQESRERALQLVEPLYRRV